MAELDFLFHRKSWHFETQPGLEGKKITEFIKSCKRKCSKKVVSIEIHISLKIKKIHLDFFFNNKSFSERGVINKKYTIPKPLQWALTKFPFNKYDYFQYEISTLTYSHWWKCFKMANTNLENICPALGIDWGAASEYALLSIFY